MFSRVINDTDFTKPYADEVFPNIRGSAYEGDVSFLATLRAVLGRRMKEDDSLEFNVITVTAEESISAVVATLLPLRNQFAIVDLSTMPEEKREESLAYICGDFCKENSGFTLLTTLKKFYEDHSSLKAAPVINPTTRQSFIFVDSLDLSKYHFLQIGITNLLPWFFEARLRMNDAYYKLLHAMGDRDPEKYLEPLSDIADMYEETFREPKLRDALGGFEHQYERKRLETISSQIGTYTAQLVSLQNQYNQTLKVRGDLQANYEALECKLSKVSDGDGEVFDFFLHSRNLHLEEVKDDRITFAVTTYASNYDPDAIDRVISNPDSYFWGNSVSSGTILTEQQRIDLVRALFIDETLRLRLCSCYDVQNHGGVYARDGYKYSSKFNGYMPNPHIQYHGCLGSYPPRINECLERWDYVGAIATCIASAGSINFMDSVVSRELFRDLFSKNCKACIELPEGTVVTPKKAVEWLAAHKPSETETSEEPVVPEEKGEEE